MTGSGAPQQHRNPFPGDVPAGFELVDARLAAWYAAQASRLVAPPVLVSAVDRIPDREPAGRSGWLLRWRILRPFDGLPASRALVLGAVLTLLVLGTILAGLFVAAQRRTVPPPFGLAGAGQLVFDAEGDLWLAQPDGSGITMLRSTPDAVELGATWSRDGTRIAFWVRGGSQSASLWVMDADGSGARPVVDGGESSHSWATQAGVNVAEAPPAVTWSPDGSRVAFGTNRGDLYVVEASGVASPTLIASRPGTPNLTPAWSPDGSLIAIRGRLTGGGGALWVIRPDGSGEEMVSHGDELAYLLADWSPDGRLVYSNPDSDIVIARRQASGWSERTLVGGQIELGWPAWSPDGARVAFLRDEPNGTPSEPLYVNDVRSLMVVDVVGGAPIRLSTKLVEDWPVCWSPDGMTIRAVAAHPLGPVSPTPGYVLLDSVSGQPVAELPAPAARSTGACSWQRLVR